MRRLRLFHLLVGCALAWVTATIPASAQFDIGIVAPAASLQDFANPFGRGLAKATSQAKVHSRSWKESGEIESETNVLIQSARATMIAIAGPRSVVEEVARRNSATGFFHLDAQAVDQVPNPDAPPNLIGFSSILPDQRTFLAAVLSSAQKPTMIGPTSATKFLDELVKKISADGTKTPTHLVADSPGRSIELLVASLAQNKPTMIGGFIADAGATALKSILPARGYSDPFVFFSAPPAQTRGYLAGLTVGLAIQKGLNAGPAMIEWMRDQPRYTKELKALAVPWSITYAKLSPELSKQAEAFFKPGVQSADNTMECYCHDKGGRRVKCKLCEPGKCVIAKDNSDDCSTECATN